MGEIEDRLKRLAEHRAAQIPAFSMPPTDEQNVPRHDVRRAPVLVGVAACVAIALLIAGAFVLARIDNPPSVHTPAGLPATRAAVGCAGKAYVTNNGDGTLSVINLATGVVSAPIAVGEFPYGVTLTPDGEHAYVSNGTPIRVGDAPSLVVPSADGTQFYVPNLSGTVSVVTTATGAVSATIPVGNIPGSPTLTPDGKHAYVPNNGDGTVAVIDTRDQCAVSHHPRRPASGVGDVHPKRQARVRNQ